MSENRALCCLAALERIVAAVQAAVDRLADAPLSPEVRAALQPLPERIRQVGALLRARVAAGTLPEDRFTAWRHDLRARATGVVGWAELYALAKDEIRRHRAVDKLAQSVATLLAFLQHPLA